MFKKMKKLVALMLVFVLAISVVGCGSEEESAKAGNKAKTEDVSNSEGSSSTDEEITLDVWHLWTTESDGNAVSFAKALEMYKTEHPNVTINIDATENEAYKTKIKTAISANEAPDVFFTWGAGFSQAFVDAGQVAKITDYLPEDALENLNMSAANNFTYNDGLYGLPFISWVGVLYCNEEMFDAAGVKVPDTMDELFAAIEAFNGQGVIPITVGAKDAWNAMFFQNVATVRTAGTEMSTQALKKNISYNQKEFVDGAQILVDLVAADAFDPSALALTYDEAKIAFLNAQSPMMFMGSWLAGEVQNPELSQVVNKVVAKNFPAIEGGSYNNEFLGGAIDGLMVSESSEHKEVAAEFVAYITEKMSRESFLQGAGIPVWNIDVEGEVVDPLVQQIVDLSTESEGYIVAWDTFLSGSDVSTHLTLVQEVFAEMKTAEEFAEGMQTLNE
ncbi:extracellular solute-binding protein [Vallitalea okinawensis]|uniref:extracellular solute-binding protein n=1 Tax=Vallitalea okinawensis TaxID=2078660 RepID=UPI000CFC5B34|nr:extracellular solute-binding protein [Vallitalea okinawensis]